MSNRVEELESQVAELQAAVDGLTEELVETRERLRQLEADAGVEVRTSAPTPTRETTDDGPADDAEVVADDAADEAKSAESEATDEPTESEPESESESGSDLEDSDIIVA